MSYQVLPHGVEPEELQGGHRLGRHLCLPASTGNPAPPFTALCPYVLMQILIQRSLRQNIIITYVYE